jgi:hypothetical protein
MNRERHRYWSAYIADVQKRMLLGHWYIALNQKPSENGSAASVSPRDGAHEALIWVSAGFDSYTRDAQRHAIVHELLHLHLAPLRYHLEMQGGRKKGEENVRARIERGHVSHEEYAVDDLARIIAPHMPLPPKAAKP